MLFFGKDGVHAGASGVVYGYFAYLVVRGFYEKSWKAIFLSVAVLFVFQGLLIGLVPGHKPGISWEGHLFGALGGISAAGMMSKGRKERKSVRTEG